MRKILATNPFNNTALIARLALSIVIFPHGAQKLLGLFGGPGWNGAIGFLTGMAGLPTFLAVLVILIESVGAILIFFGFLTRIAAFGILCEFVGVVYKIHWANGFFMNWQGSQKGEGIEYFILLFGLAIILLITGGGRASVDAAISRTPGIPKNM